MLNLFDFQLQEILEINYRQNLTLIIMTIIRIPHQLRKIYSIKIIEEQMKEQLSEFQAQFFDYSIPVPFQSTYNAQFVRSNDLRLLLQIATQSSLRMYTDSKTGKLHFICKQKGACCFDIQAEPKKNQTYGFKYNYLAQKHKGNCCFQNEAFEYLKIYNLMKMKKKLIEDYMIKIKVQNQSPSIILSKLSNSSEEYFFEKYIGGHLEFKRKLRKRFDNIINIDIKKIGKTEEEQNIAKNKKKKNLTHAKIKKNREARKQYVQKMLKKLIIIDPKPQVIKSKKTKIIKKPPTRIKRKIYNKQQRKANIMNLLAAKKQISEIKQKNILQEEDYTFEIKQQILPQIKVLTQQAQYIWSQSDSLSAQQQLQQAIMNNREDYFKSLRNSALKFSLERQSLAICFFSTESNKQNNQ